MDLFDYAELSDKKKTEPTPKEKKVYGVGELTYAIKNLLKKNFGSQKIWIKGEISNYRGKHQSGHMYFKLKDSQAILTCVFFRSMNARLKFDLQEGMEVIVGGRIDLWEKGGNYQFTIEEVQAAGQGDLHLKFEQLKKQLHSEGLFDESSKQALPVMPQRIGVITSATGAVIRDIIDVIKHRCPFVQLFLYPVKVQGDGAKENISEAITWFNRVNGDKVDLLIVGRGGGSIEDLWPFNEEVVVRAMYDSDIPIISAVGHQTDFTIADFVADKRAATPSQAAEFAVPDMSAIDEDAKNHMSAIIREVMLKKRRLSERLQRLRDARVLQDPYQFLGMKAQQLDYLQEKLKQRGENLIAEKRKSLQSLPLKLNLFLESFLEPRRHRFERLAGQLSLLNPLSILARGYSVVKDGQGKILDGVDGLKESDTLEIQLFKGELECHVTKIKNNTLKS